MARHYYGHATAAVFAPLEPASRPDQISRRLSDAIAAGLLPAGTQLPGETDLATTMGVSTVTVREALASLRTEGLVETRRGRGGGSFVRLPEGGSAELARRRLRRLSVLEIRDLGDIYATISGGAAAYAARRRGPDDIERLRTALSDYQGATDAGGRRRADAQLRVVTATVAQSPRLYHAEVQLQSELGVFLWLTLVADEAHRDDCAAAAAQLDAIESGAAETARQIAEKRVQTATARVIDLRIGEEDA